MLPVSLIDRHIRSRRKRMSLIRGWASSEVAKDAAGIVAVTLSLLVYGVLQERIMTVGFGPAQELFSASIFLVLCNR